MSNPRALLADKEPDAPLAYRPRDAAKALGISERMLWEKTKHGAVPFVLLPAAPRTKDAKPCKDCGGPRPPDATYCQACAAKRKRVSNRKSQLKVRAKKRTGQSEELGFSDE